MNHVMHKPLFGKQESQESIQESWIDQVKIIKIPESHRYWKIQGSEPLKSQTNYYITVLQPFVNQLWIFVSALQMICNTGAW